MIDEQSTSGNLPNSLASSYSRSVPDFMGRKRSHKSFSQLTLESNNRRCGLVFFDQDLDNHKFHSSNSMDKKSSKSNWIRGQYSDCWWVSNFKEEDLQEKKCPASPSLGHGSASTTSDDFFSYRESNDDSHSSSGLGTPSSTQSTACGSFASRKTISLRTPCNKMITYYDKPLPPPKCPLPPIPHSDHPCQPSPVIQHTSEKPKVQMNITPSTTNSTLPKYLRRPISFITPKPRESSPIRSAPIVTSPLSSRINPRPCITPDLKRLGNSSTYSFILPKSDILKSSGKRWKINKSTSSRFRSSPPPPTTKARRSSLGSLTDDPFRADPLVIYKYRPTFTPINSSVSDQDESCSPRPDRNLIESSERSTSPSTNPSSICELTDSVSCYHTAETEISESTIQTIEESEIIKEKDNLSNFPETFVFAPLSRLDGFFNSHPRRRSGIPSKAFTLQISPGPSKTTFKPGDQFKLGIILGNQQFDEIRVNLIGTSTSTRGNRVLHEFLKMEEKLIEDKEEIQLMIPLQRSCLCGECEKEKGVLPDSLVNENVFVSYHLNVRGIKKARWSRDEKVQVSLMVKSNHLFS
ncbi:uncharacterized protein MELLADRAFT_102108 [Melampsora larici-populina 98AG31]|uniref:Uncharacterized protein n=1 Tax=Melampsora larici-populina (strain 98AG31 / pathotype 3-4-7) TaxID=747676 RepID=F4R615_MELLP|nr:uncharacterized protein MELLADRAFT_102108 [Melampsora larici-populina 98AG31]EGG12141.1 hypothetical protein MELLADRAFT_102108 [Melampsora larici-populina 98AG31]